MGSQFLRGFFSVQNKTKVKMEEELPLMSEYPLNMINQIFRTARENVFELIKEREKIYKMKIDCLLWRNLQLKEELLAAQNSKNNVVNRKENESDGFKIAKEEIENEDINENKEYVTVIDQVNK